MEEFITIKENSQSEIVEKKSKFIANIFYVETKEEAEKIIQENKKRYHDARHNCFAYRVIENDRIIDRASDDGEPSGTAGAPMLNILVKNMLCNVLVIVTRYFGGILLGTGGLVRAYSEVTSNVIKNAEKIQKCKGFELLVKIQYSDFEKFKYYCKNNNINIINIEYSEFVVCKIELNELEKRKLLENEEIKNINISDIKILSEKYIAKSI